MYADRKNQVMVLPVLSASSAQVPNLDIHKKERASFSNTVLLESMPVNNVNASIKDIKMN